MKPVKFVCALLMFLCYHTGGYTQALQDSTGAPQHSAAADDPSQFISRVEVFNELQHRKEDINVNQTTFRGIVKLGERFTSRIDIPLMYNSYSYPGVTQFGLGDISFRLLGFKIYENPKSAFTASVEVSLNTAQSKTLGSGKNMIIPVVSYSTLLRKFKGLLSVVVQQANSVSGDKNRKDLSFSKIQVIVVKTWSRKMWTVVAPSMYVDYIDGGTAMVMEGRMAFAPKPRMNYWVQAGAGLYGDFILRYQWSAQIGYRYLLFRNKPHKK